VLVAPSVVKAGWAQDSRALLGIVFGLGAVVLNV